MITIISRESPLAKIQVTEATSLLPKTVFRIDFIKSHGDKDLKSSLMSDIPADFFTRELDRALLEGEADIAVHSAKDLPHPLPTGLQVICLTEAGNKSDSLITLDGTNFLDLPSGARIGTSSKSRVEQLTAIREDIEIVSIRGNIGQRLEYLDRHECDGVVVATCALDRLGLHALYREELPIETHPLQGNLAIVAKEDRFDLMALFAPFDIRKKFGTVTLVGAGPGDPELITRKGERKIREADIVFYDDLLDRELLTWAKSETVFVGKRKGEHHKNQTEINKLLYEASLGGKKVVRLKCGDPLLFSRGGEEIDFLRERFVPIEVVPGVSSFQGAAASNVMPLTKRGISRQLNAVSGHYEVPADIPFTNTGTQVTFMGATRLTELQESLRTKGWDEYTPVAIISRGTYTDEVVIKTTVATMDQCKPAMPAMIIIGEVTNDILSAPRILYTGIDHSRVSLPGKVVHQPLIQLVPQKPEIPFSPEEFTGIIFTSRGAVEFFLEKWSIPQGTKIVAIGPKTADILAEKGISVDAVPERYDADALQELVQKESTINWFYPCSNRSRNVIHSEPNVTTSAIYKTELVKREQLKISAFNAVFFTSPSTIDAFKDIYQQFPQYLHYIVYGAPSKKRLMAEGVTEEQITIWPIL